jgi:hypothetical protein
VQVKQTKKNLDWKCCNVCRSKDDLFDVDIEIYYTENSENLTLCRKCLIDLEGKIIHALKND